MDVSTTINTLMTTNVILLGVLIVFGIYHVLKVRHLKEDIFTAEERVRKEVDEQYRGKLELIDKRIKEINDSIDTVNNTVLNPTLRPTHRV